MTYALVNPQGSPFDQADLDGFAHYARANNWTNEQAQAAFTNHVTAIVAKDTQQRQQLEADPEIGGANLVAVQARVNQLIDRFMPATTVEGKAFRMALSKAGDGNNVHVMKLLARIAKAAAEDRPIGMGTTLAPSTPEPLIPTADLLFPSSAKKPG